MLFSKSALAIVIIAALMSFSLNSSWVQNINKVDQTFIIGIRAVARSIETRMNKRLISLEARDGYKNTYGPSMISVSLWVKHPSGKFYLYFFIIRVTASEWL